ncbi:MAG: hypothetical protein UV79_C0004G0038 [candidate division TM6 bacterium GW2011_GWF2_43_17]|nr:MAG: hypothetical protein UV79_C0004G0038 [candidate division TM6 bacterium GW2011_GWF2_43_17]HAU30477.1 hypothetical protein [Candidatus Dependentiae bacterium]
MHKYCFACGMPMSKREDFAQGDEHSNFCLHCVDEEGAVRACEEIFEGGVQFFMSELDGDRQLAEKTTRKNMRMLPYWQNHECGLLSGEVVSDEEFAEILKKLS